MLLLPITLIIIVQLSPIKTLSVVIEFEIPESYTMSWAHVDTLKFVLYLKLELKLLARVSLQGLDFGVAVGAEVCLGWWCFGWVILFSVN